MGDQPDLHYITTKLRGLAVPIDSVVQDPANARRHPTDNLEATRGSFRKFGQRKPIVVNARTGVIEAGNGFHQVMKAEGCTHIATVEVDDDPVTATGYALADNRTAELAEWDNDVLAANVRALLEAGEDLEDIGFDEDYTSKLLKDADDAESGGDGGGDGLDDVDITATLAFSSAVEQQEFFAIGRQLRKRYPDTEAGGTRLLMYLREVGRLSADDDNKDDSSTDDDV